MDGTIEYLHVGRATFGGERVTIKDRKLIDSYQQCTNWLYILMEENPNIIISEWDWNLWTK